MNGTNTRKDFLGYHRLLETSGSVLHHRPHMIHPEDWGFGRLCTLFTFNNVPNGDADSPNHRNPKQRGKVRLEIKFHAAPDKNITVLVWGEFEDTFQVGANSAILYKKTRLKTEKKKKKKMEFVSLSDVILRHLALDDLILKRVFHCVHPSDGLLSRPSRTTRAAYIVDTDLRGEPGQHWL